MGDKQRNVNQVIHIKMKLLSPWYQLSVFTNRFWPTIIPT